MTFSQLNRRTHLYLALALLPWFLMYGVSSFIFSHNEYFDERDRARGLKNWTPRFERQYEAEKPAEENLRAFGAKVLADTGVEGAFGVYRQGPNQINIYVYTFFRSTQLKYFVNEKKLVAEDMRFRWDHFLTGMHAKGGFEQGGLHDVWAVVVDLVCVGMLLWVVSGLIMWWGLPQTRMWGWAAILAGIGSFIVFVFFL